MSFTNFNLSVNNRFLFWFVIHTTEAGLMVATCTAMHPKLAKSRSHVDTSSSLSEADFLSMKQSKSRDVMPLAFSANAGKALK